MSLNYEHNTLEQELKTYATFACVAEKLRKLKNIMPLENILRDESNIAEAIAAFRKLVDINSSTNKLELQGAIILASGTFVLVAEELLCCSKKILEVEEENVSLKARVKELESQSRLNTP